MAKITVQTTALFESIKSTVEKARNQAKQPINHIMTEAYWDIGDSSSRKSKEEARGQNMAKALVKEICEA